MNEDSKIPFGKHKGKKLGEVPAQYLLWYYKQPWAQTHHPNVYSWIHRHLEEVKKRYSQEEGREFDN